MYLSYLTGALVENNLIQGVAVGTADAAVYLRDVQYSTFRGNMFYGDGVTMEYAYRDYGAASSGYCVFENETWYNMATSGIRYLEWGTTHLIRNFNLGTGGTSTYTTAGDRTIAFGDLAIPVHLRDPNGAARVDTTATAASINQTLLYYDGQSHEILYVNTGTETIRIAGGVGVTVYNNEGAGDAIIPAGASAKLILIRDSATTVKLLVTVFEAV
jgi:hypothetical protein